MCLAPLWSLAPTGQMTAGTGSVTALDLPLTAAPRPRAEPDPPPGTAQAAKTGAEVRARLVLNPRQDAQPGLPRMLIPAAAQQVAMQPPRLEPAARRLAKPKPTPTRRSERAPARAARRWPAQPMLRAHHDPQSPAASDQTTSPPSHVRHFSGRRRAVRRSNRAIRS